MDKIQDKHMEKGVIHSLQQLLLLGGKTILQPTPLRLLYFHVTFSTHPRVLRYGHEFTNMKAKSKEEGGAMEQDGKDPQLRGSRTTE